MDVSFLYKQVMLENAAVIMSTPHAQSHRWKPRRPCLLSPSSRWSHGGANVMTDSVFLNGNQLIITVGFRGSNIGFQGGNKGESALALMAFAVWLICCKIC